jgi:hypothetical protein
MGAETRSPRNGLDAVFIHCVLDAVPLLVDLLDDDLRIAKRQ